MNTKEAYNSWSAQYDTNINKTRDLEAVAIRSVLAPFSPSAILEIGCGTGKNSEWLVTKTKKLLGADLSPEMLAKATKKITNPSASFVQADIMQPWDFAEDNSFELVTFSLVLEHIEHLDFIFQQAGKKLVTGGRIYAGELHPFKQYAGSKARFSEGDTETVLDCYTHHISDFTEAAETNGFRIEAIHEWFDENDKKGIPRVLTLLFTVV